MSDQITLISSDGLSFLTSANFSQLSGFVLRVIQDYSNEEIHLHVVSSTMLRKILLYSEHHNFTLPGPQKRPVQSVELHQNLSDPWDAEFITQLSDPELVDLISAADYLDMKSLLEVCFIAAATNFIGKSVDDLKTLYQIKEQPTPEIEDQFKKEFPWSLDIVNVDDS